MSILQKKIILAKSAGFCFGVKRAVDEAEKQARNYDNIIYTYGELIHNPQEISRLKEKGLIPVHSVSDIAGNKVIIRTHGVGKDIIDKLNKNNIEIIDLTCPFVKKIHNIANKCCNEGIKTVIIGNEVHPEVVGICGWCRDNYVVISNADMVKEKIKPDENIYIVAQTTIDRRMWNEITSEILKINKNATICDTICSATNERQIETAELAKKVDAMYVIGGRSSSNTKKLYDAAKTACNNTFHIEQAREIDFKQLAKFDTIGITAGASTPDHIIKEVIITMENLKTQDELNFEAMLEESLKTLNTGDTVKGTIVDIKPTEIVLELEGCKYNGIIDLNNLTDDPTVKPADLVKMGEEIEAFVIQVDDNNGQIRLSRKKLEQEKNWEKIQEAFEKSEILAGKVVEILGSGIIVLCTGIRVFVPASQSSDRYMADLNELKGKEVQLRIIDIVTGRRRRVVGSIKSVLKEENQKKKEAFWADAEEGKSYTGTVKSLTAFGVFVDIGGIDGLVHISELSWKRITHPKQVVKEGDKIDVYIKSLDKEKQKVSLGCKKEEDNPWKKFVAKYTVGDIASGTVVRLVPFGAFVDIDGVDGLVHISELSWRRINHPSEVLKEGQVVEVIIKDIDAEKQKISLGYKRIEDNPWEVFRNKYNIGDVIKCKVVRIAAFGAFAEIIEGVDGLIHISQISDKRVGSVAEALKPGDEVEAKIVDIKEEEGKVSLSIRALLEETNEAAEDIADEAIEEPAAEEPTAEATEEPATEEPTAEATEEPAQETQE